MVWIKDRVSINSSKNYGRTPLPEFCQIRIKIFFVGIPCVYYAYFIIPLGIPTKNVHINCLMYNSISSLICLCNNLTLFPKSLRIIYLLERSKINNIVVRKFTNKIWNMEIWKIMPEFF